MRKIFTLCFLLIALNAFTQTGITPAVRSTSCFGSQASKPVDTTRRTLSCQRSITGNSQLLIVIDGIPANHSAISNLGREDIDSIQVLKSAIASALYGYEGANGALAITTKKPSKFIIKDFTDGSPVAGATVLFTSLKDRNEKIQFVANDSGVVSTKKLNGSGRYQMTVSAAGHITTEQVFESNVIKEKEIFLNREIKNCDEVVLTSTFCPGTRRTSICYRWFCCGVRGIKITADAEKEEQSVASSLEFKVYPNPVQRGTAFNLQFNNENGIGKITRIISLDGKTFLQEILPVNKGLTHFTIATDARWSAGIYFVQLLYENGRIAASEKIILQ